MRAEADVATFDLDAVRRFADLAVEGLSAAREEIDALNVYPVPDGDTGTNMFLTVESARDAMNEALAQDPGDLRLAMRAYARGALLGARGNSGVILSQLVGALLRRIGQAGPDDRSAAVFAEGMALATDAAYAAVGQAGRGHDPLRRAGGVGGGGRVGRAAGRPARRRGPRGGRRPRGRPWPARPSSCPLLAQAGVVDAGGRGLCVVLDAAESAITGKRATSGDPARRDAGDPGREHPHR